MEEFKSYFKYCSDNKDVISGIFRDHKIRFTQPWGMNDPLEFDPTLEIHLREDIYRNYELDGIILPSVEQFYRIQVIESQINAYGILSLTKQPLSFDMWSRYANGHKGFVLEFKPDFVSHACMKSKNGKENVVRKVQYVENYSLNLGEWLSKSKTIPFDVLQNEFFFKKTSRWEEEQEFRLIRPLTDYPGYKPISDRSHRDGKIYLFDFSLECIASVMFGANMSASNKRMIIDSCENYRIDFFQAYLVRNKKDEIDNKPGNVKFVSAKSIGSKEIFCSLQPQLFVVDEGQQNDRETIKIHTLKQLPYYEDYKEIVDDFLQGEKQQNNNSKG